MSFKKLGIALAAMAALGAVLASSAFAGTAVTDPAAWTKTNKETGAHETISKENIRCSVTPGEKFVLRSKVLGSEIEWTATGIECPGGFVETTTTGASWAAIAKGKITFTGITVHKPSGCKTPATNRTNEMVAELYMDEAETQRGYVKLMPTAGPTANITSVKLEGCAAAGSYPLKGTLYMQATNDTDVHANVQELIGNETTHAMSSLKFGNEPVTLTGEFGVELDSGESWGAENPTE